MRKRKRKRRSPLNEASSPNTATIQGATPEKAAVKFTCDRVAFLPIDIQRVEEQ